jgi:ribose 1,5-bisphosphokinase
MSWFVDIRALSGTRPGMIGPGRLVLVVGPSGAGKDTLIGGARLECADDPSVVFPRRVVTRPPSAAEDHETICVESFEQTAAARGFALWWHAHGNRYGIRASIDDDIRSGKTVICNVSRTIVGLARERYANVAVVLITAPQRVLEARLAARARSSDADIVQRIMRSAEIEQSEEPDFVIRNVGRPEIGIRRLLNVIRDPGFFVIF